MADVASLLLKISGDSDDAEDSLEALAAKLAALDGSDAEVDVKADNRQALSSLEQARRALMAFARESATAEADVDTQDAMSRLREMRLALERIDLAHADAKVTADVARAITELQTVEAAVERLDGKTAVIDVDVRRGLVENLTGVGSTIGRLLPNLTQLGDEGGRVGGVFATLGASVGGATAKFATSKPAILAVAGAIVGDLMFAIFALASGAAAMVGSAGAAALGIGALGAAATGAGLAFGGFIGGAIAVFSDEAKFAGTAANLLKTALTDLGKAFKTAVAPGAREMFKGLTEGIKAIIPQLDLLRPAFLEMGKQMGLAAKQAGDAIAGMMPKFATLIRESSRLAVPLSEAFTGLLDVLTNIATAAMPFLVQGVQAVADQFARWGEATSNIEAVRGVIAGLVSHLRSWWNLGVQISKVFLEFFKVVAPFGQQLVDWLAQGAAKLAEWVKSKEGTEAIRSFFQSMLPIVKQLVPFIGRLATLFVLWMQASAPLFGPLLKLGNTILSVLIPAFQKLMPVITHLLGMMGTMALGPLGIVVNLFRLLGETASLAASKIGPAWQNVSALLSTIWTGLAQTATMIWDGITAGISLAANLAKDAAVAAWNLGKTLLTDAWNGIKEAATLAWNGITSVVSDAANLAKDGAVAAWNLGKTLLTGAWTGIKDAASLAWSLISSTIGTAATGAKNLAVSAWNLGKTALTGVWNTIKSAAATAWNGIKKTISDAVTGALNFIKSIASQFYEAGRALAQKVADGIRAGISAVKGAAQDLASAVRSALPGSEPKDPHSPLRNLDKAGKAIVLNLAKGLHLGRRDLARALTDALVVARHRELQRKIGKFARPSPVVAAGSPAAGMINQNEFNFQIHTQGSGMPDPSWLVSQLATVLAARGGLR